MAKKEWKEFQECGMLWWANRILHVFGWAIVFVQEKDGSISDVYPARVTCRGFDGESETEGFRKVSRWFFEKGEELKAEALREEASSDDGKLEFFDGPPTPFG